MTHYIFMIAKAIRLSSQTYLGMTLTENSILEEDSAGIEIRNPCLENAQNNNVNMNKMVAEDRRRQSISSSGESWGSEEGRVYRDSRPGRRRQQHVQQRQHQQQLQRQTQHQPYTLSKNDENENEECTVLTSTPRKDSGTLYTNNRTDPEENTIWSVKSEGDCIKTSSSINWSWTTGGAKDVMEREEEEEEEEEEDWTGCKDAGSVGSFVQAVPSVSVPLASEDSDLGESADFESFR